MASNRNSFKLGVSVERPWKSAKYEVVYLKAYENVSDVRAGVSRCIAFCNTGDHTGRMVGRRRT